MVTKRFVDRSAAQGSWKEPKAFVAHEMVMQSRTRWKNEGGLFKNMKVVLLLSNKQRQGVYSRLVRAGGGEVYDDWRLEELLDNQPGPEDLSLVVADCELLSKVDSRHAKFLRWLQLTARLSHCPPHFYFKYIFEMLREVRVLDTEPYSIFCLAVLNRARSDGNLGPKVDYAK